MPRPDPNTGLYQARPRARTRGGVAGCVVEALVSYLVCSGGTRALSVGGGGALRLIT